MVCKRMLPTEIFKASKSSPGDQGASQGLESKRKLELHRQHHMQLAKPLGLLAEASLNEKGSVRQLSLVT